jgi:hypothetical protein
MPISPVPEAGTPVRPGWSRVSAGGQARAHAALAKHAAVSYGWSPLKVCHCGRSQRQSCGWNCEQRKPSANDHDSPSSSHSGLLPSHQCDGNAPTVGIKRSGSLRPKAAGKQGKFRRPRRWRPAPRPDVGAATARRAIRVGWGLGEDAVESPDVHSVLPARALARVIVTRNIADGD